MNENMKVNLDLISANFRTTSRLTQLFQRTLIKMNIEFKKRKKKRKKKAFTQYSSGWKLQNVINLSKFCVDVVFSSFG